jgi:dUTP pyrophosphatase
MPTRSHPYDAGLDLYAPKNMEPVVLHPFGGSADIDTGTHIAIPRHFAGLVKSRSGLMKKRIYTDGTIDPDYTGAIRVTMINHGSEEWTVVPGDRIAQLVIVPCCLPPLELAETLEVKDRGDNGFGSTGR